MTKFSMISGFVGFEGQSVQLAIGDEYPDDHPLVKAMPQHFASRDAKSGTANPAPVKRGRGRG